MHMDDSDDDETERKCYLPPEKTFERMQLNLKLPNVSADPRERFAKYASEPAHSLISVDRDCIKPTRSNGADHACLRPVVGASGMRPNILLQVAQNAINAAPLSRIAEKVDPDVKPRRVRSPSPAAHDESPIPSPTGRSRRIFAGKFQSENVYMHSSSTAMCPPIARTVRRPMAAWSCNTEHPIQEGPELELSDSDQDITSTSDERNSHSFKCHRPVSSDITSEFKFCRRRFGKKLSHHSEEGRSTERNDTLQPISTHQFSGVSFSKAPAVKFRPDVDMNAERSRTLSPAARDESPIPGPYSPSARLPAQKFQSERVFGHEDPSAICPPFKRSCMRPIAAWGNDAESSVNEGEGQNLTDLEYDLACIYGEEGPYSLKNRPISRDIRSEFKLRRFRFSKRSVDGDEQNGRSVTINDASPSEFPRPGYRRLRGDQLEPISSNRFAQSGRGASSSKEDKNGGSFMQASFTK